MTDTSIGSCVGIEVENRIKLPDYPAKEKVPYLFKGTNTNEQTVLLKPAPACGCTTASGPFEVAPGADFVVDGYYTATSARNYTKTITLHIAKDGQNYNSDHVITLTFSGTLK